MDEMPSTRTRHDLVIGNVHQNGLLGTKEVGEAFCYEGTNYYVMNFWSLDRPFFLVPNRDHEARYTVFRKKIDTEDRPIFQKPVGRAWVSSDLRTHLQIVFNFPRETAFMCLFPADPQ